MCHAAVSPHYAGRDFPLGDEGPQIVLRRVGVERDLRPLEHLYVDDKLSMNSIPILYEIPSEIGTTLSEGIPVSIGATLLRSPYRCRSARSHF